MPSCQAGVRRHPCLVHPPWSPESFSANAAAGPPPPQPVRSCVHFPDNLSTCTVPWPWPSARLPRRCRLSSTSTCCCGCTPGRFCRAGWHAPVAIQPGAPLNRDGGRVIVGHLPGHVEHLHLPLVFHVPLVVLLPPSARRCARADPIVLNNSDAACAPADHVATELHKVQQAHSSPRQLPQRMGK